MKDKKFCYKLQIHTKPEITLGTPKDREAQIDSQGVTKHYPINPNHQLRHSPNQISKIKHKEMRTRANFSHIVSNFNGWCNKRVKEDS